MEAVVFVDFVVDIDASEEVGCPFRRMALEPMEDRK